MNGTMTRRTFLKGASCLAAMTALSPVVTTASANSKLNLACIGVGGKGIGDLENYACHPYVNIVALCDVDEPALLASVKRFPDARGYLDWRKMFDLHKNIDAVHVCTPDHMHAPITLSAMARGKHVYCQKPLTHNLYEARQIPLAARKYNVISQMGIQYHSFIGYRMAVEIIQSGVIGKIKEVHAWTDRPIWPQGNIAPLVTGPAPRTFHWDMWLGVAPNRPFAPEAYHPFKWRGFLEFGTGALGDMGCHMIDTVVAALQLGAPHSIKAEKGAASDQMYPRAEMIHFDFAGTPYTQGSALRLTWYDGGLLPAPSLIPLGKDQTLPESAALFIGQQGVLLLPFTGGPQLLPREKFMSYKRPRLKPINHYHQWVDACLGRDKTQADFDYSGPLTEICLLGVLASRFPTQELLWDAPNLRVTNFPDANQFIRQSYRPGWEISV